MFIERQSPRPIKSGQVGVPINMAPLTGFTGDGRSVRAAGSSPASMAKLAGQAVRPLAILQASRPSHALLGSGIFGVDPQGFSKLC